MKRNSKVGCLLSLHTNFTTVLFEAMPDFCKGETMAEVVAGPSGVSSSNWFPANCQNCYLCYGDFCVTFTGKYQVLF